MQSSRIQRRALQGLLALWIVASFFFLLFGLTLNDHFFLQLRLEKWLALNVIGVAVAISTYLFQTVTHSRILTPSIMGLDAVYLLFSLLIITLLGSQYYFSMSPMTLFFINCVLMSGFALLVFGGLILKFSRDMNRLLLIGIVLGLLIQAVNEFLGRMTSPEDYVAFQGAAFARFDQLDRQVLWVATSLLFVCLFIVWRLRFVLDIFRLGRSHVINLGITYLPMTCLLLMLVAALVSIATALVGPILFFGLLIVAIVQQCFSNTSSSFQLSAVAIIGALILVAGQTFFEHALGMKATLSVVIEVLGGSVFFMLLLRRRQA